MTDETKTPEAKQETAAERRAREEREEARAAKAAEDEIARVNDLRRQAAAARLGKNL